MTGRSGNTRCANTFLGFSKRDSCADCAERITLAEAEVFELVAALFDDLIIINPDVAISR